MKKIAAADIGSNAVRLQISQVPERQQEPSLKKLEYIRFPLRLGSDVFGSGKIQKRTEEKFVKLMHAFRTFLDLYEVDDYRICATSAMREAQNARQICDRVYCSEGLQIDIIDGNEEAELIGRAVFPFIDEQETVHIDVGGGSSEINLYRNREKFAAKSFKIGSVRELSDKNKAEVFDKINRWLSEQKVRGNKQTKAVGTGGNINKLYHLSGCNSSKLLSLKKLEERLSVLSAMSNEERIHRLLLNEDRADVILPAGEIYLKIMQTVGLSEIKVPGIGLKEGIILSLFDEHRLN